MPRKVQDRNDEAAFAFVRELKAAGWRHVNTWTDGGHLFQMMAAGPKTILVQLYPGTGGSGFEVWRPITSSNSIPETAAAVEEWRKSQ